MKLFLLRHYAKPNFDITQNRTLLVMGTLLPMILLMAWAFPGAAGVWMATSMTAVLGAVTPQRPTQFEAALPISGRDIAVARLISAFAVNITPILLATAIVAFNRVPFPGFELATSLTIAALAVLLPRLVRAKELTATAGGSLTPVLVMGIVAGTAILGLSHWQALALLSTATIVAGSVWWNRVPHAFQVAPLSASSNSDRTTDAEVSDIANGVTWWRVAVPIVFSKNRVFMSAMMIMGGAMGNWQLFLFSVLMTEDLWQRTRWMQSMPISHRARLWIVLLPAIVMPFSFFLVGLQIHWPGGDYFQGVHRGAINTDKQEPRYFDSPTSVSLEYWEKAKGDVPLITAPWGETVQPYVVHVFNRTYYNPYTARKASSDRFTNWQYERLTTAFFGEPLALKDHDDGQINPRRLNAAPRMMILNIATGLVLAFLFLFGWGFTRWYRAWAHQAIVGVLAVLLIFVPMGTWLFTIVAYGLQQGAMNVLVPLLERQLMNLSAALPSNILAVIALAAIPVFAAYALLAWQFKNSEVVGPAPKL